MDLNKELSPSAAAALGALKVLAADLKSVEETVGTMTMEEKAFKLAEVSEIVDEGFRELDDSYDDWIGDIRWNYCELLEMVDKPSVLTTAKPKKAKSPAKRAAKSTSGNGKEAAQAKQKRPEPTTFNMDDAIAKLPAETPAISSDDVRAGKAIPLVNEDDLTDLDFSDIASGYDSEGEEDEATLIRDMIASSHDAPIIAKQGPRAKRRLAGQADDVTAGTQTASQNPRKKRQRLKADKEKDFPDLSDKLEEYRPWLNVDQVLEIGAKFVAGSGDRKRRGQHVESAAYKRHKAAPYAWNYRGQLYRAFWPFRKLKKNGRQILSDKQIAIYCHGLKEDHELMPWTVNAQGEVYSRLPSEIKAVRDRAGKFRARKDDDPLLVNDLHKSDALAAAVSGENDLIKLKEFNAKDFGITRFTADREEGLRTNTIAVITTARNARVAKKTKELIQRAVAKAVAKAETESQQRLVSLEEELTYNRERKLFWKQRFLTIRENIALATGWSEKDLEAWRGNGDQDDEEINEMHDGE